MDVSKKIFIAISMALATTAGAAGEDPNKPETFSTHLDWLRTRRLVTKYHAEGVQQYECNGKTWVHQGPAATLTDSTGKVIGIHYSCANCDKPGTQVPAWNFYDGGHVEGTGVDKDNAKNKDSVPHLSLKLEGNAKGKTAEANHVVRVNTSGGIAPPKGTCATAEDKGKWFAAKYKADYEFRDINTEAAPAAESGKAKSTESSGAVKAQ